MNIKAESKLLSSEKTGAKIARRASNKARKPSMPGSLQQEKQEQENTSEENPFWMSIGDLMSLLLLIFALLLLPLLT